MFLQGKTVHVTTKTGIVFEGIFFTANSEATTENDFGIVLKMARKVKDPSIKDRLPRTITRSLVINSADFVEIEARDLPAVVGRDGSSGGFTDTEISGSNVKVNTCTHI